MTHIEVVKADLTLEAGFPQPEFSLFENTSAFLGHIFKRLGPQGLRLADLRVERGSGSLGDLHIACLMFNYWMTVRFRVDRLEIVCAELPRNYVESVKTTAVSAMTAVRDHHPIHSYRTLSVTVGLHATINGQTSQQFLSGFAANQPHGVGPVTGNGIVFYFGPEADRLNSSITADLSAVIQNAVYIRIQGTWDASKVLAESAISGAERFVDEALASIGLQRQSD